MNDFAQKLYECIDNGVNNLDAKLSQAYHNDPHGYERKLQAGWASAAGAVSASAEYAAHKLPSNGRLNQFAKVALHVTALGTGTFALLRVADYVEERAATAIQ